MTISLCMILRKEDLPFLNTCLMNTAPGVDEIIIVIDKPDQDIAAVADQYKARLITQPFPESFAEQRNRSIAEAQMDWILVLDADEILAAGDLDRLKAAAKGAVVACSLVQLTYTNDTAQERFVPAKNELTQQFGFAGYFPVEMIRFFRNHQGISFTRRVHEMVDEIIEQKGLAQQVVRTDIPIHHLKMLRPSLREDELRYLQLLQLEVKEHPDSAKAWFDIGTIQFFTLRNPFAAAASLERALTLRPSFTEAGMNLAFVYGHLKRYKEALAVYRRLPADAAVLSGMGTCLFHLGRHAKAISCYRQAAALQPEKKEEIEKKIALIRAARPVPGKGRKRGSRAQSQE
ncbi:MAG: tetratricopeptide repeat protein [Candidatus Aenigmarchaeota archaeon]|nr:tetratricopeptide repeat protein [Candidatus Aenigmarchaeota archaeon]